MNKLKTSTSTSDSLKLAKPDINLMPGYVVVINRKGKIIQSNSAWNEIMLRNNLLFNLSITNDYFEVRQRFNREDTFNAYKGINSILNGELDHFSMEFYCHLTKQRYKKEVLPIQLEDNSTGAIISHIVKVKYEKVPGPDVIAEKSYQALFESFTEGVMVVDLPGGTIRKVNQAVADFTGYDIDELVGKTFWSITPQKWHDLEQILVVKQLATKGCTGEFEKEYIRKDGTTIPISLQCWPLKDANGKMIAAWSIIKDLSVKKRIEQEKLQAQKMESLGTLAGGIAHEFNNILSIIMANTELMEISLPEHMAELPGISNILKATNRASELVNQIVAFSHLDTTQLVPTDVTHVVNKVVNIVSSTLPRPIQLKTHITDEKLVAMANDSQIQQLIINICGNAAQAMDKQDGIICVELFPYHSEEYQQPHLRLCISNNGKGLSKSEAMRLFDPFYTTKPFGTGKGLGLSVVHGIVNRHDGYIKVDNDGAFGTRFNIDIPLYQGQSLQPEDCLKSFDVAGKHVLIVEEESALATVYQAYFEHLGCKVSVCGDGTSALQKFKQSPKAFDLVFTDQSIPGITGKRLAEEIRSICQDTPIVLVMAGNEEARLFDSGGLNIHHCFTKPVSMQGIAYCIEELM